MSEIRTNLTVSGESSEYRGNISISVVTLNSNLVDTQSSFRTNIEVSLNIDNDIVSSIKTNLELNNVALDFYLVDMTKLNQSILYFSKFFNMNFEPELVWEMLAQGTNEQINTSHLSDALSNYVKIGSLDNIYNSITNLGNTVNNHITNSVIHLTSEEKDFIKTIMITPPWSTGTSGLFEYVNVGDSVNTIWAVRPLLNKGKDVGIISNTFISCKGVDVSAGGFGGGITRADLFSILRGDPQDTNEYINEKYLKLDNILSNYATKEWSLKTFVQKEKDPTVPNHVKAITEQQIYSWDLVASLFSVSEDDTYILVNDNRGFVSTSFISCKGLDETTVQAGGNISEDDFEVILFNILKGSPDSGQYINTEFLDLSSYATTNWVSDNYILKSTYNNQIQSINTNISKKADKTLTISAGNGLTGGGSLEDNRTITLGTPSTITDTTDNNVTEDSHTHKINKASTTVVGIVQLYDALTSNSNALALTANQGKILGDRVILLENMWENKTTYLLAKNNRGIVSNSFISVKGLDNSAPQTGGSFDRSSLFDILSSSPNTGEYINIDYLDLSDYATKSELASKISLDEADKRYVLITVFNTLNTKVNDFLEGSDTDNIINKWKELEAFLAGQTESSTLADLLGYKLDAYTYNTFIGDNFTNGAANNSLKLDGTSKGDLFSSLSSNTSNPISISIGGTSKSITQNSLRASLGLGTAAYKSSDDFLSSTTKYAIADAVGGNALNALNANRLGEQEPTYYAKASDLQPLLDAIGIDDNGDVYIKKDGEVARNFWTYGAISFGGVGSGGGSTGGITALSALSDVALGTLLNGDVLTWNGSKWVNKAISSGLDITAMWNALATVDNTKVIDSSHIPDLSSKYLSLGGGTIYQKENSIVPLAIRHSYPYISYQDASGTQYGYLGFNGINSLVMWEPDATTARTIYHSGNFNPSDYLPKSGGTLSSNATNVVTLNSLSPSDTGVYLRMEHNSIKVGEFGHGWGLGTYILANDHTLRITNSGIGYLNDNLLIHSGNYTDYALPKTGGTLTGPLTLSSGASSAYDKTALSFIRTLNSTEQARIGTDNSGGIGVYSVGNIYLRGNVTLGEGSTNGVVIYKDWLSFNANAIIHEGNYSTTTDNRYLQLTGGTIIGNLNITSGNIGIYDNAGNGILAPLSASNTWTGVSGEAVMVVGSPAYKTVIRTNADNLYHYNLSAGKQYKIYDSGNLTKETLGVYARTATVNGTSWNIAGTTNAPTTFDIYAPTTKGSSGQFLRSSGTGAPIWENIYWYDSSISRTANTVLAAPNGSNGVATFRALVAADIPTVNTVLCQGGTSNVNRPIVLTNKNNGLWYAPRTLVNYVTGDITLYSESGDSPALIFQRGAIDDYTTTFDWKTFVSGGDLYFQTNYNGWTTKFKIDYYGEGYIDKLTVENNIYTNGDIILNDTTGTSSISRKLKFLRRTGSDDYWDYGLYAQSTKGLTFYQSANGVNTDIAYLDCYGNFVVTGAITFGSDARYKTKLSDVTIDLETIANAPLFNYKWNDREDNKEHLGTTAQYWNNTNFRNAVCPTTDEKLWTMSYSEIAMGNTIVLARELIPIKREVSKIEKLESRVSKLERILREHNINFD